MEVEVEVEVEVEALEVAVLVSFVLFFSSMFPVVHYGRVLGPLEVVELSKDAELLMLW